MDNSTPQPKPKMTVLKFLKDSGVATTKEILDFGKVDPKGFQGLVQMAKDTMTFLGIEIEERASGNAPTIVQAAAV